jgi:hypothetical protein
MVVLDAFPMAVVKIAAALSLTVKGTLRAPPFFRSWLSARAGALAGGLSAKATAAFVAASFLPLANRSERDVANLAYFVV